MICTAEIKAFKLPINIVCVTNIRTLLLINRCISQLLRTQPSFVFVVKATQ